MFHWIQLQEWPIKLLNLNEKTQFFLFIWLLSDSSINTFRTNKALHRSPPWQIFNYMPHWKFSIIFRIQRLKAGIRSAWNNSTLNVFIVYALNWPFLLDKILVNGDVDWWWRWCWRRRPTKIWFQRMRVASVSREPFNEPSLKCCMWMWWYAWSWGWLFCHWQLNHNALLATTLNDMNSINTAERLLHWRV